MHKGILIVGLLINQTASASLSILQNSLHNSLKGLLSLLVGEKWSDDPWEQPFTPLSARLNLQDRCKPQTFSLCTILQKEHSAILISAVPQNITPEKFSCMTLRKDLCKIREFMDLSKLKTIKFRSDYCVGKINDKRQSYFLFMSALVLLRQGINTITSVFTDNIKLTVSYDNNIQQWIAKLKN